MQPAYGGEPLPLSPIVLPLIEGISGCIRRAEEYVKVLDKELAANVETPKWNGQQARYIRQLRAKWMVRALGKDAHYLKHGTFRRPFNADPPGWADWWQEQARRKEETRTGQRVSTAAHRRKWMTGRSAHINEIVKRLQKKYGTKPQKPKDD